MKLSTLLLTIAFLGYSVNAQAATYQNLCGACVGNGFSYCPSTGVCYNSTEPINNPIVQYIAVDNCTNITTVTNFYFNGTRVVSLSQTRGANTTNSTKPATTTNSTKPGTSRCFNVTSS
jgi:hypothetical protein